MTEAVATVALALPDQDRDSLPTIRSMSRDLRPTRRVDRHRWQTTKPSGLMPKGT